MTYMRYLAAAVALAGLAALQLLPNGKAVAEGGAAGWGTLKGQVVYGGAPLPKQMPIAKVNEHQDKVACQAQGVTVDQDWVVNLKTKGVQWTFVWLQADKGQKLPIHPDLQAIKQKELVIDQPCCTFLPHALGMREGQWLIAKNTAPMPHNFKWSGLPTKNPGNNVLIPSKGQIEIKDLVADRFPVSVSCTIHPWMKAWVRVYDHPYFAVTDENGNFEIKNAPAGNYHLVVWHESVGWGNAGGKNGDPITIKAGGMTEVPKIELKAAK